MMKHIRLLISILWILYCIPLYAEESKSYLEAHSGLQLTIQGNFTPASYLGSSLSLIHRSTYTTGYRIGGEVQYHHTTEHSPESSSGTLMVYYQFLRYITPQYRSMMYYNYGPILQYEYGDYGLLKTHSVGGGGSGSLGIEYSLMPTISLFCEYMTFGMFMFDIEEHTYRIDITPRMYVGIILYQ